MEAASETTTDQEDQTKDRESGGDKELTKRTGKAQIYTPHTSETRGPAHEWHSRAALLFLFFCCFIWIGFLKKKKYFRAFLIIKHFLWIPPNPLVVFSAAHPPCGFYVCDFKQMYLSTSFRGHVTLHDFTWATCAPSTSPSPHRHTHLQWCVATSEWLFSGAPPLYWQVEVLIAFWIEGWASARGEELL